MIRIVNLKRRNSPFDLLGDKKKNENGRCCFKNLSFCFSGVDAKTRCLRYLLPLLHQLPPISAGSRLRGEEGGGGGCRLWLGLVERRRCGLLSPRLHPPTASSTPTERRGCKSDLRVSALEAITSLCSQSR